MNKILIIAEAGVNHNGNFEFAKALVVAAANAGADIIKFQTFKADKIVNKNAKKADYQKNNINDGDESQYNMLKKLEMPDDWHIKLINYSKDHGIQFLSTGFDQESIDLLDKLGSPFFKIPSGEITNKPFLQHVAGKGKPVIISTGMADMDEIQAALDIFTENGIPKSKITVLHCNTEYPTQMEDVNLKAMTSIRDRLGVNVGYSDHTEGYEIPIAATALGAIVIEKHLTLDKNMEGPDHKASIEPDEFKKMVDGIRKIERAIGNGIKRPSVSEIKNKIIVRKSIVASAFIKKGDLFSATNLSTKRPGDGLSPMLWDTVIGSEAKRDFNPDEQIEL